ncbi:MAG: hypothetical protein LBV79_01080 [Candidatus Adiutrix sp.]|jgi:hypothetical protein|nr:hypothetical protein [Candidatus Adiutrix sp.]
MAADPFSLDAAAQGIGGDDWRRFNQLTSVELSEEAKALAARPGRTAPEAREYLAVHWHPEWAPLELIQTRLNLAFPHAENFLAIPTQHNKVMSLGPWAGVEADVYDRRYGQKVQLLIHLPASRLARASAFLGMMEHTYNYRARQLMDILARLAEPDKAVRKAQADLQCSLSDEGIAMARFYAVRLRALIEQSGILGGPRDEMLKNRLLPDFMAASTPPKQADLLGQAVIFAKAVKKIVKADLRPEKFFSPQEVIEEDRSLGAGVIIPHPPLFWPILLSGLDVDGWEVWNPSSPRHTLFLLEAMQRANESRKKARRLLAFMGDDTHLSAKITPEPGDEKDSARREIGFQPPWTEPDVAAALKDSGQSLTNTLNEYRARMG